YTAQGLMTVDDVSATVTACLTENPTLLVIWDLRQASFSGVTGEDLRKVVIAARPLAESRAGGKTAIVCSPGADFGLARIFQIYAEVYEAPIDIKVFDSMDGATSWLGVDPNRLPD
ncbi:MAG TPA: hypothetical protein VEV84_09975, partial [Pyrinomonadaceae bacterium]|nr:hypothetical protein [Pyrinomonadaceae bacterium]